MITYNSQFIEVMSLIKAEKRLYTSTGKLNSAFLRRDSFVNSELHRLIHQSTQFLKLDAPISERIYCIENNIYERSNCVCGRELTFITNTTGYLKSCNKCIRKVASEWKSSSLTSSSNMNTERSEFFKYIEDTSEPEAQTDQVIAFIEEKRKGIAESIKWVSRADYRDNKHILKKIIHMTKYMSWSVNNYNWSNRMYNIFYNTHEGKVCDICKKQKTRYVNFLQGYNTCCKNKKCIQEYGCKNRVLNHIKEITPVIDKQGFDIIVGTDYKGLNHENVNLRCRECNSMLNYDIKNGYWKNIRCHICNGESGTSYQEKTVLSFVKGIEDQVEENCRILDNSFKELDIYVPRKNLAIEYNGSIWHSYGTTFPNNVSQMQKHKSRHYQKHKLCSEQGIKLLQINSYEWCNKHKKNVWESIIRNNLGVSCRLYARRCEVVEVSTDECGRFLNDNHLQGKCNSKIRYGLKYQGKLVSVMTFSKPRFSKKYQWELVRFCNLLGHTVVGGASKLLSHFLHKYKPQSLISYADLRYSNGNMYKSIGFNFVKHTPPSYVYIKGEKIVSRFAAQKHRLKKLLKKFDKNQTEQQNMLNAGYRKLWDAGTMLFEYKNVNSQQKL